MPFSGPTVYPPVLMPTAAGVELRPGAGEEPRRGPVMEVDEGTCSIGADPEAEVVLDGPAAALLLEVDSCEAEGMGDGARELVRAVTVDLLEGLG